MPEWLARRLQRTEFALAAVIVVVAATFSRRLALFPDPVQRGRPGREPIRSRRSWRWACSSCWCRAASTSRSPPPPRSPNMPRPTWPARARRAGRRLRLRSACIVGVLLGCVNALLIHYLRVASIIVTIATMSVYFALLMYVTGGKSIYNLPDWWTRPRRLLRSYETASGDIVRITMPIVVMVLVALATASPDDPHPCRPADLRRGRQSRGGEPASASTSGRAHLGLRLSRLHGRAGRLWSRPTASARACRTRCSAASSTCWRRRCSAGRASNGGIGTVPGVLLGVLLLAMLQNGLNLLGVSSYFFQIVIGLAILVLDRRSRCSRAGAGGAGGDAVSEPACLRLRPAAIGLDRRLDRASCRSLRGGAPGDLAGLAVLLIALVAALLRPAARRLPSTSHAAIDHVPAAASSGCCRSRW